MSSIYGRKLKVAIFGQSHGPAIGVTIDGFPSGMKLNDGFISDFMKRRAPGQDRYSTARKEADEPEFLSGIADGCTSGAPITAIIRNTDTRSGDYKGFSETPRPSHADYTAFMKYGESADFRGGGHFSGRLTAPLCIAGALCSDLLSRNGIVITSSVTEIAGIKGDMEKMKEAISEARAEGDSVGGVIECTVSGLPAGIGDPIFDGMENRIASAVFGIPAVRGIEFGNGFGAARLRGSENNDPFVIRDGAVMTKTNNNGGINGGITNGMPVVFRVAFRPTPSIAKPQKTADIRKLEETEIQITGRHDPCIVLRALPCVESAAAIAVLDAMLEDGAELTTD